MIPLLRTPKPPQKLLIAHWANKRGKSIYQDVEGINEQGKWYLPDSVKGKKLRSIQTGKYFNFTGVEDITFSKNITSIIGWFDSGSGWDEAHNFSADISGAVFTPTGKVARLDVTFTDASKGFLYCDDTAGLIAYDALTVDGNNGTINLGGQPESSFRATSNEVQSIQNEAGYQPDWYVNAGDQEANIGIMAIGDIVEFSTITTDQQCAIIYFGGSVYTSWDQQGSSPHVGWNPIIEIDGNIFSGVRLELRDLVADGELHTWKITTNVQYNFSLFNITFASYRYTGYCSAITHKNASGQVIKVVESYIPIAQDGNGKTDVLGYPVLFDYYGQVQYPMLVKGSSVGYFDGNLVLTFSDLSGRSITAQTGEVTVEISGNNIQPVSGTGKLYTLTFDNGSNYQFSEVNGLTVFDLNTTNALDGTWDLLGSPDGTQYSSSVNQRPNNLLDGFTRGWVVNEGNYEIAIGPMTSGDSLEFSTITTDLNCGILYATGRNIYWDQQNSPALDRWPAVIEIDEVVLPVETTRRELRDLVSDGEIHHWKITTNVFVSPSMFDQPFSDYHYTGYCSTITHKNSSGDILQVIEGNYLPADPANIGYDVVGNVLGIKGSSIFINPSENTYNRNPFDTPALAAIGIPDTEDISYIDITGDKSRFYDNAEENRVISLLTYSDFVEPFAGSVFQGDNNISFTHPDLSGITIISWVGTATPTKSGNDILVDTGTLLELILSDGSKYIWSEETGLIAYDLLKLNNLIINLNGSALGTQYTQLVNKDYHHNLLWGYTVGGIFDGAISGKFSETDNTDSAWRIQGFKVEIECIFDGDLGTEALFSNERSDIPIGIDGFGFGRVDVTDTLFVRINGQTLISAGIVPVGTRCTIVISKKPNSASVKVSINENEEAILFSTATINYDSSELSVVAGAIYDYATTAYTTHFTGTMKKLRVTEIDEDEDEVNELIDTDWINGDGISTPNIATDAPTSSDLTWIGGTGEYTGLIPGDPAKFGFDVEGSKIDGVVLAKVKKYRRINNYLRR